MGYIQDKLERYKRKQVLEKITCGLGSVIEGENTIYCYVDEKLFKNKCDYDNIYGFNLMHQPVIIHGSIYNLNKDIVYIFDGIFFDKPLSFYISSKSHNYIKFQNCIFTRRVSVCHAENVEFFNNRSISHVVSFSAKGKEKVKNIQFINDKTLSGFANTTYIDISCNTLEIHNTDFHSDNPKINVENLTMNNSHIYSFETMEIDADKIELTNSDIHSSVEINLNTKECNDFSSIKAHDITYNGLSLSKHNNSYEEIDKLIETRQLLVDTLATIKSTEEQRQKDEINKYRKELKNAPLSRRLKR